MWSAPKRSAAANMPNALSAHLFVLLPKGEGGVKRRMRGNEIE